MVCLLAILLYTGTRLSRKDRFIIATSEFRYPSYGNYEVNYNQLFPKPGKDSGIYRTQVKIDRPGTYITVYCSNKMPIDGLWRFVSNGLISLQGRLDGGFSNDESSENECFNHVNKLYREQVEEAAKGGIQEGRGAESAPLLVSNIIESHHCTKRLLISHDPHLPAIEFCMQLEIADAVLDGRFIMHEIEVGREDALAWNQGQLQLFKRESFLHSWAEATKVGYEPYTGGLIVEFIQSNNAKVRHFMKRFSVQHCGSSALRCFRVRDKTSLGLEALRSHRLINLSGKIKKLAPLPADGTLYGVKICEPTDWPEEGFSNDKLQEFMGKQEKWVWDGVRSPSFSMCGTA